MKDEFYMKQALKKARAVLGKTNPNPAVGAVLVKNGKIVGSGSTQNYGSHHAEVMAIKAAGKNAVGATLYVTLEPCNHFGQTPPCTELILTAQIAKVVVGIKDPNPQVAGKGILRLRRNQVIVQLGVLKKQILDFYRNYTFFVKFKRPYVTLKIAQSLEGALNEKKGVQTAISHLSSQSFVHQLRNSVDAVLVGGNTLKIDNPDLTPRTLSKGERKYPDCLVLTKGRKFSQSLNLLKAGRKSRTFILSPIPPQAPAHVGWEKISLSPKFPIPEVLRVCTEKGYHSLLVESGPNLLGKWIKSGLFDRLIVIQSPRSFPGGERWSDKLPPNWQKSLKIDKFTPLREDCVWVFCPEV